MGNIASKNPQNLSAPVTPLFERFRCIHSVFSLAVDNITGRIYVLRVVSTGCVISEWGYDRLIALSAEGEIIYSHKINYNFTNITNETFGLMRNGCQFDLHGITFHNNLIYITNRSSKVISVLTENAELVCIIRMPHRDTVYISKQHYAYGVGLMRETRGSTRLDVDEDGLFMCHYNSVLSIMHGIRPVYYELVKEREGQTLDLTIHMDKLHVLSRDGSIHTITVMTKDGIHLNVYMQEENILASLTFTIDNAGVYYISDGASVIKWDGDNIETVYTDQINIRRNNGIERGIMFDSQNQLIIVECSIGSNCKLKFCTL